MLLVVCRKVLPWKQIFIVLETLIILMNLKFVDLNVFFFNLILNEEFGGESENQKYRTFICKYNFNFHS